MAIFLGNPFPIACAEGIVLSQRAPSCIWDFQHCSLCSSMLKATLKTELGVYSEAGLVRLVTSSLLWQCFRRIDFPDYPT